MLLFVFSFRLLEIIAFWTKYLLEFPHFIGVTFPVAYLFGVLLYFYVKYLTSDTQSFDRRFWWHLIPFFLVVLLMSPLFFMETEVKIQMLEVFLVSDTIDNQGINWVVLFQFPHILTYLWLTIRLLNQQLVYSDSGKSELPRNTYVWLKILTIGFAAGYCFWVFNGAGIIQDRTYFRLIDYISTSAMAVFIYGIGFLAFKMPEIHSYSPSAPKYSNSSLTEEAASRLEEKLKQIMESEKLYLDASLSLSDLCEKLDVSANHLSQLLNERLSQNFFDFVNSYRIEEAKHLLSQPESKKFTLTSIAFEVGFNNKTSFNNYFKKITGTTPSQFSKAQHNPEN